VGFSNDSFKSELSLQIENYVTQHSTLKLNWVNDQKIQIYQKTDHRTISLNLSDVTEVLTRSDHEGDQFLQLNLSHDRKLLITKNLVGFKPAQVTGLDMARVPKVVTTVDLASVIEAIEELLTSDQQTALIEVDVLKKVYHAIVFGGEKVGFNLDNEKRWLAYNLNHHQRASA